MIRMMRGNMKEERDFYAIIFDLGGVCFSDGTKKFISYISNQYNIPLCQISDLLNGEIGSLYRSGKISKERFWFLFRAGLNINDHGTINFSEQWNQLYEPNYEMLELLNILSRNHYSLYYLSDNVEDRVIYLKQHYSFFDLFQGGIFSYEIGCRKPNIVMYERILDMINIKPQKCLYIDDKVEFLKPANSLGMKTIHFIDVKKLCREFERYGINYKRG